MKIIEINLKLINKLKKLNSPSIIVIHHAAHSSATVNDIRRWHLENGWSRFGYHFLIRKDGQIYRGRPENPVESYIKGYNSISLGICIEWDYGI
ncbi:MAG: N-acetylmuramoyl-L-alanine amidase [Clostridia bacterium]|nr:N-acetylmuramoyl-L-alanine amidase [Clostridia bacterium]